MNTLELKNDKHTRADFARMKSVLACASKDSTRHVITKVLVEKTETGITIITTDGKRMRSDSFNLEAEAGIYDIKINSAKAVFLTQCEEGLVFPNYRQAIPDHTDEAAHSFTGTGSRFVLWVASSLGCYLDPKLIALADDEFVTLHIQKDNPNLFPVVLKNDQTTLVVMPYRIDKHWEQQIDAILTERVMKAMEEKETDAIAA
ncbi:hypothetical protein PDESU_02996 [Pontiella desulfatans]|uniref:DNA polymerase III subunit beta n=1 Tax=Pontiella desulfatans TaxID=2750659 RepID=A0A6C2U3I8_PONDE|nr:hypothetical protein [Pontiella desulfatans]VGO14435.1 hypothetical protein PDESU_02996 [Pontiella desulfatans]